MALDATVKGVSANSYLTVTEANDLLTSERLYVDAWNNASQDEQERALIWSTRLLDHYFSWFGVKTTETQALRWPRWGVKDPDWDYYDKDTLPKPLKLTTADLALELLKEDRLSKPDLLGQGFSSVEVGPLSVEVDPSRVQPLIPDRIVDQLTYLGEPIHGRGGLNQVSLKRT